MIKFKIRMTISFSKTTINFFCLNNKTNRQHLKIITINRLRPCSLQMVRRLKAIRHQRWQTSALATLKRVVETTALPCLIFSESSAFVTMLAESLTELGRRSWQARVRMNSVCLKWQRKQVYANSLTATLPSLQLKSRAKSKSTALSNSTTLHRREKWWQESFRT